jgi:hypothetical protein
MTMKELIDAYIEMGFSKAEARNMFAWTGNELGIIS